MPNPPLPRHFYVILADLDPEINMKSFAEANMYLLERERISVEGGTFTVSDEKGAFLCSFENCLGLATSNGSCYGKNILN